jgi:hypothetical protein
METYEDATTLGEEPETLTSEEWRWLHGATHEED